MLSGKPGSARFLSLTSDLLLAKMRIDNNVVPPSTSLRHLFNTYLVSGQAIAYGTKCASSSAKVLYGWKGQERKNERKHKAKTSATSMEILPLAPGPLQTRRTTSECVWDLLGQHACLVIEKGSCGGSQAEGAPLARSH